MPALATSNQNTNLTSSIGGSAPGVGDTVVIKATANSYPGETWSNDIGSLTFAANFTGTVGATSGPLKLTCSAGSVNIIGGTEINLAGTTATAEVATLTIHPSNPNLKVTLSSGEFKTILQSGGNVTVTNDCEVGIGSGITIEGGQMNILSTTTAFTAPSITVRGNGRLVLERDVATLTVDHGAQAWVRTVIDGSTPPTPTTINVQDGGVCHYSAGNAADVNLTNGGVLDCTDAPGIIAFGALVAVGLVKIRAKRGLTPTFSGTTAANGAAVEWEYV